MVACPFLEWPSACGQSSSLYHSPRTVPGTSMSRLRRTEDSQLGWEGQFLPRRILFGRWGARREGMKRLVLEEYIRIWYVLICFFSSGSQIYQNCRSGFCYQLIYTLRCSDSITTKERAVLTRAEIRESGATTRHSELIKKLLLKHASIRPNT